jgi:hypothetical protein
MQFPWDLNFFPQDWDIKRKATYALNLSGFCLSMGSLPYASVIVIPSTTKPWQEAKKMRSPDLGLSTSKTMN